MSDTTMMKEFPSQDQRAAVCLGKFKDNTMVTANAEVSGLVSIRKFKGEDHLVVPVIAVKAKVLNGELLPAEEIARFIEAWNGIPVTVGHPEVNGKFVSARSPEVFEQESIGFLFNARFENDRLKAEMWIRLKDVENAEEDVKKAVENLKRGIPTDVSTGYFAEVVPEEGTFNGEKFIGIQINIVPDHLAILPNERGACSWEDGCGAPRINREDQNTNNTIGESMSEQKVVLNLLKRARTPKFNGTETTPWSDVDKSLDAFVNGYFKAIGEERPDDFPSRVEDMPQTAKDWIASKTLLGDPDADTVDELIFFPVVNPSTDRLNRGALRAVLSGRGAQADITEEQLNSARAVARRLLEEEFEVETNSVRKFVEFLANIFGITGGGEERKTISCPRCGNTHEGLEFNEISNPDNEFDLWSTCPETGQPVLAVNGVENSTVLQKVLTKLIKERSTTPQSEEEIISLLAKHAGTDKKRIRRILNGEMLFVPLRWLHAFSQVLDISPHILFEAADIDQHVFVQDTASDTLNNKEHVSLNIDNTKNDSTVNNTDMCPCKGDITNMTDVRELASNAGIELTEEEEQALKGLPEETLVKLFSRKASANAEDDSEKETAVNASADKEEGADQEGIKSVGEEHDDLNQLKEELQYMKSIINQFKAEQEAKKKEAIDYIVANSDFSEEDLNGKSFEEISKLVSLIRKTVAGGFYGRALPRDYGKKSNTLGVPEPPSILLRQET